MYMFPSDWLMCASITCQCGGSEQVDQGAEHVGSLPNTCQHLRETQVIRQNLSVTLRRQVINTFSLPMRHVLMLCPGFDVSGNPSASVIHTPHRIFVLGYLVNVRNQRYRLVLGIKSGNGCLGIIEVIFMVWDSYFSIFSSFQKYDNRLIVSVFISSVTDKGVIRTKRLLS